MSTSRYGVIRLSAKLVERGPATITCRFTAGPPVKLAPMPAIRQTMNGGGMFINDGLAYGESWGIMLDLGKYIKPLPPGEYTVVFQYHNDIQISMLDDISNLVVSQSEPIKLTIAKAAAE